MYRPIMTGSPVAGSATTNPTTRTTALPATELKSLMPVKPPRYKVWPTRYTRIGFPDGFPSLNRYPFKPLGTSSKFSPAGETLPALTDRTREAAQVQHHSVGTHAVLVLCSGFCRPANRNVLSRNNQAGVKQKLQQRGSATKNIEVFISRQLHCRQLSKLNSRARRQYRSNIHLEAIRRACVAFHIAHRAVGVEPALRNNGDIRRVQRLRIGLEQSGNIDNRLIGTRFARLTVPLFVPWLFPVSSPLSSHSVVVIPDPAIGLVQRNRVLAAVRPLDHERVLRSVHTDDRGVKLVDFCRRRIWW